MLLLQSDHWRGSVVQADASTKTYEWDGHYFYDRATGDGGVWVTNFSFNGRTQDPTTLPGFPAEYAPYFGPGTGGVITHNQVDVDPSCVAKARAASPYAKPTPKAACRDVSGGVGTRHLGPVTLGMPEGTVRNVLGPPVRIHRGFLRYCVRGGGKQLIGFPGDRSGERGAARTTARRSCSRPTRRCGPAASAAGEPVRAAPGLPRARRLFVQGRTPRVAPAPGPAGGRPPRARPLPRGLRPGRGTHRHRAADWLRRSQ